MFPSFSLGIEIDITENLVLFFLGGGVKGLKGKE